MLRFSVVIGGAFWQRFGALGNSLRVLGDIPISISTSISVGLASGAIGSTRNRPGGPTEVATGLTLPLLEFDTGVL